jgi:hypothetical protein
MWKGFSISAPRFTLEQVSDEIEALPQNEQEKIRSDLHGSSAEDAFVEKPEIVDQALRDLTLEISLIPNEEKAQFLRALALCPDYVNERAFCLMFLRGEEFDTKVSGKLFSQAETKIKKEYPNSRTLGSSTSDGSSLGSQGINIRRDSLQANCRR